MDVDGESAQDQSLGHPPQSSVTSDEDYGIPDRAALGDHCGQGGDHWVQGEVSRHRHPHHTPTVRQP